MKILEKDILLSEFDVKAILKGVKSEIRVPLSTQAVDVRDMPNEPGLWFAQTDLDPACGMYFRCSYGGIGDLLYGKETHLLYGDPPGNVHYRASANKADVDWLKGKLGLKWRPSVHMRKEYARIWLEIEFIYIDRLQNIDIAGYLSEGVEVQLNDFNGKRNRSFYELALNLRFRKYWDSLYAKPRPCREAGKIDHYVAFPWDKPKQYEALHKGKMLMLYWNPWVWVIRFKRVKRDLSPARGFSEA